MVNSNTDEMEIEFYTIGVYGFTPDKFFEKILSNNIDTFLDIRHRRAVRGSQYSFANSNRLQNKLSELGINYIHLPDLSPSDEIRAIQFSSDKSNKTTIRGRDTLDSKFISEYKKSVLDRYNFDDLFEELNKLNCKRALFFCVESNAEACHRSLITEKLKKEYSVSIIHL
jgi:uncharacterized protein (DUF488 family)